MPTAVVIPTEGSVTRVDLPATPEEWLVSLGDLIGGAPEAARYHPEALLHVHGDGARTEQPNLTAWALASTWRGLVLPYSLFGPVVVTSATERSDLSQDLVAQVESAADAVAEVFGEWRRRRPVSPEAGVQELLAAVRFRVSAGA